MGWNSLGKRERTARKRHRRGSVWCSDWPAGSDPLKVGSSHSKRRIRRICTVADAETLAKGAKEI